MGRGLDGLISRFLEELCSFEGPPGLARLPVAIAWGKHLFPFRTEQLSPTAPMVLGSQGPGRVGRRRFFDHEPPRGRLVVVVAPRRVAMPVCVAERRQVATGRTGARAPVNGIIEGRTGRRLRRGARGAGEAARW